MDGEAEALSHKAVELALAGGTVALRLWLELAAAGAVLQAVLSVDLTPTEAAQVMGLVDSYRYTLEVAELDARVAALENRGV